MSKPAAEATAAKPATVPPSAQTPPATPPQVQPAPGLAAEADAKQAKPSQGIEAKPTIAPAADAATPPTVAQPTTATADGSAKDQPGSAAPKPPAVPAVQRLIVAATGMAAPPDAKVVPSLAAACREASALGVEIIELQFDGVREESSLDISSPRLTIRNADGFHPAILFRPNFEDLAWERRMIRVAGGNLDWHGVHVRMELPSEPADNWAIFSLHGCVSLDLQDAVLTVANADSQGRLLQDRVALIEVAAVQRSDPAAGSAAEDAAQRVIPPYLGLSNCVARGQATLIHCEQATPLRIVCRQSLLVTSDWLLDCDGTDTKPVQMDARIELSLKNVTAALGQGLCRLSSDTLRPFQLDLLTDCKNSILYVTHAGSPVIERRGIRELAELEKHLYLRGRDNFYPGSTILLRLNPTGDPQSFVDCGFAGRSESWYQEESPRFSLMWKSLPSPESPLDRHIPADYLLDDSEQNPALLNGGETRAGVDNGLLPPIPNLATPTAGQP